MIKFNECPRCHGDIFLSEDTFGKYLSCMQCGYLHDLEQPALESKQEAGTLQESELGVA